MDRRAFLGMSIALPSALRLRSDGRLVEVKRGAVVIGVDKAGNLPKLRAAASGAHAVAAWLRAEKFDVKLFADDERPVVASDLFTAVKDFVDLGTLDQLVIYFAGHGFISGTLSEFWLLSGAPDNLNEAVSLTESCVLAELSGIPNVVFISDACRSRADSLRAERMHGQVIFPARSVNLAKISDVDQFLAARVGAAAYEASASATASADAYAGIFTTCFLNAFRHPYTEMVQSSLRDGLVVPNRRLKLYLAQEVPKLASQIDIKLVQQPDSKVLCDDVTYIGHASASDRPVSGRDLPTVLDVARLEIWGKNGAPGTGSTFLPAAIEAVATTSGFNNAREVVVRSRGLASDPSVRSGFTISGTRVESVVAGGGAEAKVIEATESNSASATISVDLRGQRAVSVAVRFVDGSGTVLAAIAQFIGNVVVDKGLVSNVSYAPSRTSPLWSTYNQEALRLESLHSAVAAAARLGVFRVEGPKATRQSESSRFADRIRVLKGIDPTLGLYAAYAYADAGLRDGVASVRSNMFNNLEVHLFDIELLSDHLSGRDSTAGDTVPCCPMLSQGWGLLRVKNVRLPDSIRALQDHLRVSLWTTLDNKGMQIVENELKVGKLR